MSNRATWNDRYANAGDEPQPPSAFLAAHLDALPRGCALDVACGAGRHSLFLARRGWSVVAIDFAPAALRRLLGAAQRDRLPIAAIAANLEDVPLPRDRFDVVVNVRYLQRSLFAGLKAAVRRGGVVVCETFLRDQQQLGHPKNPAFLLERGELAERFADFEILHLEEGKFETESGPAFLGRILARRP